MKLLWICGTTALLAAAGAYAGEDAPTTQVCVHNQAMVENFVMQRAQKLVSALFSDAGVRLVWLSPRECRNAPATVLRIEMDPEAPASLGPEVMAYALPYATSGAAIHVFYARVLADHRDQRVEVLGHVIAHEIGHVLEGVSRHSSTGLMKAHWDLRDFARMKKNRMPFAAEDLILLGPRADRP